MMPFLVSTPASTAQLNDAVNRHLARAGRTEWSSFGITSISGTNSTRDGLLVTGEYDTPSKAAQDPRLPHTLAHGGDDGQHEGAGASDGPQP
jgi:hypothetical protein